MEESDPIKKINNKPPEIKTYHVPLVLGDFEESTSIYTNTLTKSSKEHIINQAIRLHSQGKTSEATTYYQYCINKGFYDPIVFCNYALILRDHGKLKEAALLTRKAIDIQPDFFEAYSNLGSILKDLGHLKEAELILRKAIDINPNEAEVYYNLANILKYLGILQEAEILYQKAIELKPDFPFAQINYGNLLLYLGKIKEYIDFSKSILESKSVDDGNKLITSLSISIAYLIEGSFLESLFCINRTKNLIDQGKVHSINDKTDKQYFLSFFLFITSLYPLLEKKTCRLDLEKIPHFGESQCLSFSHQTLPLGSKISKIQPVLITGAKASYFASKENNRWKDSLIQQVKNHNYNDKVFISFGEIDCRKDEYILSYAIKKDKAISEVCKETIKEYINYMEITLSPIYKKRYYFGVPAPTLKKEFSDELDLKRKEMIKIFNSILKQEVLSMGSYFLDVYELTSTVDGENNNFHMCDPTHLSPKCLSILFEYHLCEPDSYPELTS